MSYRAYHGYDDDRDVITCVTLSDTRPVARKEYTCGGCKRRSRWGCATAAGSCSSTASRGTRRRGSISITGDIYGHTSDNTAGAAVDGLTDALGL